MKFDELPFDSILFFSSLQNLLGLTIFFCLFVSLRLLLIFFVQSKKKEKKNLRFNIMWQDFTQFYTLLWLRFMQMLKSELDQLTRPLA